jgi:hypothetical protein
MASFELVEAEPNIIMKNVKIDKIVFVKRCYSRRMATFSGGMSPKQPKGYKRGHTMCVL